MSGSDRFDPLAIKESRIQRVKVFVAASLGIMLAVSLMFFMSKCPKLSDDDRLELTYRSDIAIVHNVSDDTGISNEVEGELLGYRLFDALGWVSFLLLGVLISGTLISKYREKLRIPIQRFSTKDTRYLLTLLIFSLIAVYVGFSGIYGTGGGIAAGGMFAVIVVFYKARLRARELRYVATEKIAFKLFFMFPLFLVICAIVPVLQGYVPFYSGVPVDIWQYKAVLMLMEITLVLSVSTALIIMLDRLFPIASSYGFNIVVEADRLRNGEDMI